MGDVLIAPSIMECEGGSGVRGSTYRSKYRTLIHCVFNYIHIFVL